MPHRRLLLIDDETDIQTVAKIGLTLNTDWQVITANSGEAGLETAIATIPDAILLDVAMPGMDGLATLAALQKNTIHLSQSDCWFLRLETLDVYKEMRVLSYFTAWTTWRDFLSRSVV